MLSARDLLESEFVQGMFSGSVLVSGTALRRSLPPGRVFWLHVAVPAPRYLASNSIEDQPAQSAISTRRATQI